MKHVLITSILISFFSIALAQVGRHHKVGGKGNIEIPNTRELLWNEKSSSADSLYSKWTKKSLENWQKNGKVNEPRILLAHLLLKKDLEKVNNYIQTLEPRGTVGSKWALNPNGDYDFTLTTLTTILYLFDKKPDVLYPESKNQILNVLLTLEGNNYNDKVPRTLKLFKDSENHILMSEGSRYLKNRYLMLNGNNDPKFNNIENGMEKKLLKEVDDIYTNGLHEFNSMPYLGYTICALLNLEAFGSERMRKSSQRALDYINYCYALGSYQFKYYPPFRRLYSRATNTRLSADYHTAFIKIWLSYLPQYNDITIKHGDHQALIGACMPYRPADEIVKLTENKENTYFIKLGHGKWSCPEIYSSDSKYLLSAGGANRGRGSMIVARPICLFLDDNSKNINEIFHIKGKGNNFMKWNNTGVYKNFACSNGKVNIPKKYNAAISNKMWNIYRIEQNLCIAVHSSENLGVMVIFKRNDIEKLAEELLKHNGNEKILKNTFVYPNGKTIEYNLNSNRRKWVITKINGIKTDRKFGKWELISGNINIK